ncbi:MAG: hypothetical protein ACOC4M_13715 [Promethearchaeia archaeon]
MPPNCSESVGKPSDGGVKSNKIRRLRTAGGHRCFPINEIQRFLARDSEKSDLVKKPPIPSKKSTRCAISVRISSHKQKKDLER